ncbi:thiamine-phosphate kinase [Leptospira ognonensis]|uniref:Thiamine-monophosphate kinase n=1 Tax=Leptospira ognonensis TaxID=2484945 RepID=A0A4R9KAU4_9LEPT|nr:thiamine-phosphate kinase [Leptospira ognonensis]TGL63848.1 thiamine-phosphate kinase [Leptospira ognonensis]
MKESEVIHAFFKGQIPPDDDCHFILPNQLVTTDSLVEGTHFLHDWSSPAQLAEKLIEVNVSDIAASGGLPEICFLNLGLSNLSKKDEWVNDFSNAFRKKLKTHKMKLVGGDTFFSKTTHLTLTVIGTCKSHWTRSGGINGDYLYLTGHIGDSELGLQCLKNQTKGKEFQRAIKKHLTPRSRSRLVESLHKFQIHACMDLTDGLIQDSQRLAFASGGELEIDMTSLPISKIAFQQLGWDGVLGSGEELELIFLSNSILPKEIDRVKITKIGSFTKSYIKRKESSLVRFLNGNQIYHPKKIGYSHF